MSEKQYRDKITSIKKDQASQEGLLAKARAAAAKHRAESAKQAGKITSRTSESSAKTYQRSAQASDAKAVAEDAKAAAASKKLATLARDLANAESNLAREVKSTAKKDADARAASVRKQEQDDSKRRAAEKRHAQELARLAAPPTGQIRPIRSPRREELRVLYLTASPEMDLRVDAEVRMVQQAVKAALHRDEIAFALRPAATPEDLLDGLNDIRPHVVHFSGHAGGQTLVFDNASVETPEARELTFDLLARVLAATESPPTLLVLNGCDTLDGSEVLLDSVPVVTAMATTITDLGAATFAAQFYRAIASAQPVQVALDQGALAMDLLGLAEGWKPTLMVRDGVSLNELTLIKRGT